MEDKLRNLIEAHCESMKLTLQLISISLKPSGKPQKELEDAQKYTHMLERELARLKVNLQLQDTGA